MQADAATRSWLTTLSGNNTWTGSLALTITDLLGLNAYTWPTAQSSSSTGISGLARTASGSSLVQRDIAHANAAPFALYPNPTSSALTLERAQGGEAVLYSLTGVKFWAQNFASGETMVQMPKTPAAGTYLVRFRGKDGSTSQTWLV